MKFLKLTEYKTVLCRMGWKDGVKHPIFLEEWKNATKKTREMLSEHFKRYEDSGVAVVTGKESDLTVIDFDTKNNELMAELMAICPTYCVQTMKGYHLYYRYDPDFKQGTKRFGAGVDVRNDGGLIFCPPTEHYEAWGDNEIEPLNEEAKKLLLQNYTESEGKKIDLRTTETRNDDLFRKACGWATHYDKQEVWNRIVKANRDFHKGELDEKELEVVYQQAIGYAEGGKKEVVEEVKKEEKKSKVQFVSFSSVLQEAFDELTNLDPNDVISFGYGFLDDKMTGIFPSDLIVIGGESGTGKTTFATNIIYRASKTKKCTVFALEDRLVDYGIKAMYFEIGKLRKNQNKNNYPWNEYRKNNLREKAEFSDIFGAAADNLKNENIEFAKVDFQMDIDIMEEIIRERVKNGTKLFLIDHLHYFDLSKDSGGNKADYIEKVMVRMKTVQNSTGASILLIAHYKKLDGKKPTLDSFKDSIAIVQNASYVISLYRDRTSDSERYKTTFIIPKSRNPNGEGNIEVVFDPDTNDYLSPGEWKRTQVTKSDSYEV